MTSVRKRKMARSSVKKNTKHTKDLRKKVTITGHPLVQKYWDPKLTLKQNYEKLGLALSLGKEKGGMEPKLETVSERRAREGDSEDSDSENEEKTPSLGVVATETDPMKIPVGEARIIRDPETNEVLEVIHGQMQPQEAPKKESEFSIISKLEEYTKEHAKPPREARPTEREDYWLAQLREKHGEDYEKMKWDKKLNPTFMSVGQLKRKMAQYKKVHGLA
ncbi:hypothetical protein HF325_006666 [Metschnikowia pulcherrima]|uniref:Nucleolar protein 16 n=1 Tax=Metschnikowia pulcherrima TaxID=27326 RepID=A0A8H7GMM0_9ASCO|nr:hypothetical protein HF325_006666 [Metschnikowia pulcherrima]